MSICSINPPNKSSIKTFNNSRLFKIHKQESKTVNTSKISPGRVHVGSTTEKKSTYIDRIQQRNMEKKLNSSIESLSISKCALPKIKLKPSEQYYQYTNQHANGFMPQSKMQISPPKFRKLQSKQNSPENKQNQLIKIPETL